MKKYKRIILAAVIIFAMVLGCADNNNQKRMFTLEEIEQMINEEDKQCANYQFDYETIQKYIAPVWDSQIIYNETALFIAEANGETKPLALIYKAAKILSVKKSNNLNGEAFIEGKDYILTQDGKIALTSDSAIQPVTYEAYYPEASDWFYKHPDGKVSGITSSAALIRQYELSITYIRVQEYEGSKPVSCHNHLTTLKQEINGTLNLLFLGDSITEGSGPSNANPPYIPPYCDMVSEAIASVYYKDINKITAQNFEIEEGKLNYFNAGVGGITAFQYKYILDNNANEMPYAGEYIKSRALAITPTALLMLEEADVVFLAFGVNDGGGWVGGKGETPTVFRSNIIILINKIKEVNPQASIVLVSSMKPNDRVFIDQACATPLLGANASSYEEQLIGYAQDKQNMAIAPVWGVHNSLMRNGKPLNNFLADGRNHPNDFMSRIYAQTILTTILPEGDLKTYPEI